jgi:ribosomal protein L11 methyltransferase
MTEWVNRLQWWQVEFEIPNEAAEAAAALLGDWPEVGGVMLEGQHAGAMHPEFGEWYELPPRETDDVTVTVYVPQHLAEPDIALRVQAVLDRIESAGLAVGPARTSLRTQLVDPEAWENAWKEQFHAMPVGKRLMVVPKWEAPAAPWRETQRLPVIIEPGMAFGTGLHATSQLCLEALEHADVAGQVLLDVGCGTGILSIAGARLGAKTVYAVDLDPVAVTAARANVADNQLADVVDVREGNLLSTAPNLMYDVIVANLLRDPVIALTPQAAKQLRPGGRYITSGYVDTQADAVRAALLAAGLHVTDVLQRDDWVAIVAERPA